MRVSAYPYPDYGTLQGMIRQIAQDTSKPATQQTDNISRVQKPASF